METACWENCGETIPFFFLSCFLCLNAVDKGMRQWPKYASQKKWVVLLTLWRLPGWLNQVSWPLWVSASSSPFSGESFTWVAHHCPGRTSASTWEKLPGRKEVSLSEERGFLQNQTKVTFLLTKRIFMQKAFQMSLKQRGEMNLKCLTYAFSALSSNYDNLGGYVNYTILVKWHNYEMLGQKQKRITLL